MVIKIKKSDIVWNYAGNIINLGTSVIILPIVLKILTPQELGLWYVFASIAALVNLMDFGFSPTIMRNITYAWSGATEIKREGIAQIINSGDTNYALLRSIIKSSRKIYLIISLIAWSVMISIGSIYIYSLLTENHLINLIAWIIYSVATFFNLLFSYWAPILKGIGRIKESNQITIISRLVYVVFALIGLWLGGGLVWLSITYLVSGLVVRLLSKSIFRKIAGHRLTGIREIACENSKEIFEKIWFNAKKQGVVTIGAWLITRSSALLCSSFLGLEITSQYGLSLQLLGVIGGFSTILYSSYAPEMVSVKVGNETDRFKIILSRTVVIQWFISLLGIVALNLLGPMLLQAIGSNSVLLPWDTFLLLSIILFLEWNHSTFASIIAQSNKIPFVKSSIISGSLIIFFSIIALKYTSLGILGLLLSQGIVQLSYNNWKWPYVVLHENRLSLQSMFLLATNDLKTCFGILHVKKRPVS